MQIQMHIIIYTEKLTRVTISIEPQNSFHRKLMKKIFYFRETLKPIWLKMLLLGLSETVSKISKQFRRVRERHPLPVQGSDRRKNHKIQKEEPAVKKAEEERMDTRVAFQD